MDHQRWFCTAKIQLSSYKNTKLVAANSVCAVITAYTGVTATRRIFFFHIAIIASLCQSGFMTINLDTKPHYNYDVMYDLYVTQEKSVREISNTLHISQRLVESMIKTHGLKR